MITLPDPPSAAANNHCEASDEADRPRTECEIASHPPLHPAPVEPKPPAERRGGLARRVLTWDFFRVTMDEDPISAMASIASRVSVIYGMCSCIIVVIQVWIAAETRSDVADQFFFPMLGVVLLGMLVSLVAVILALASLASGRLLPILGIMTQAALAGIIPPLLLFLLIIQIYGR